MSGKQNKNILYKRKKKKKDPDKIHKDQGIHLTSAA